MKRNKVLIGLLSTGIVASSIPLITLTGCNNKNPSKPAVDLEVDDSYVFKSNEGYVESATSTQGACYLTGFKLKDGLAVSDLSVEVTNVTQIYEAGITAEIEDYGSNYFGVNIYFVCKDAITRKTAKFDIVLKHSSGSTVKITGFEVYGFFATERIDFYGNVRQTVATTLKSGVNYEYIINGNFERCAGPIEQNSSQLKVCLADQHGTKIDTVTAEIINDDSIRFNVKLKFDDLFKFDTTKAYNLEFTNSDYPEWKSKQRINIKRVTDANKMYEFEYSKITNKATVKKCMCSDKEVVVPDTIIVDGVTYKVDMVVSKAFNENINIESITFGDNITTISESAISYCRNLKTIKIGKNANISLSGTDYIFRACPAIKTIQIDTNNTKLKSDNPKAYILKNSGTDAAPIWDTLLKATNNIAEIPDSVTKIYEGAFAHLNGLETVTIPDTVTQIGASAFAQCPQLNTVSFESSPKIKQILNSTFESCPLLSSISIPNTVTSLGDYAFRECVSLQTINMPSSLESIGKLCFAKCIGLTCNITIPAATIEMGANPFAGCNSLTSLKVDSSNTIYKSKSNDTELNCIYYTFPETSYNYVVGGLSNAKLPDNAIVGESAFAFNSCVSFNLNNAIALEKYAFNECLLLKTITNYSRVKQIGVGAFGDCASLEEINLSEVEEIKPDAFEYCISLQKVNFGNKLTDIPRSCFHTCLSLKNIVLPSNIKTIGNYAFENCAFLESINFNEAENIEQECCRGCYSLSTVTFDNNSKLTTIPSDCFEACVSLTSITLPGSITTIGRNAFCAAISLKNITIPASVKLIESNAFDECISLTSATFENINGWTKDGTAIKPETLQDKASAAKILLENKKLQREDEK